MKKIVLVLTMIAFVGVLSVGCKSDKKEVAKVVYYCPMGCEGDKTYENKDLKCPVCEMDLVVKENHENNHDENHEH